MDALECFGSVIATSALIADADGDLFQNHEAGFMLKCFAIDSLDFSRCRCKTHSHIRIACSWLCL